ncbi:MAG: hypothetical protein MUF80_08540 [Burkholderiales bacterium]|nr:hypothetical protein [Burkholderiales bacterium]
METTERIATAAADGTLRNIDQAAAGTHEAINKVSEATRPAIVRIASGAHQAQSQPVMCRRVHVP